MIDPGARVTLLVCRGCCCADDDPAADHRQRRLAIAVEDHRDVALRFTNCLGPCGEADVVGVRQSTGTTWLGGIRDAEVVALVDWVRSARLETIPPELLSRVLDDPSLSFTPEHEMTATDRPLTQPS